MSWADTQRNHFNTPGEPNYCLHAITASLRVRKAENFDLKLDWNALFFLAWGLDTRHIFYNFTFLHPLKSSRTIVHGGNYGAAGSAVRGAKFVFCLSSHFRVFSRHFATWLVGFPVIGVQWHYDFSSSLHSYTTVLMLGHTVCWAGFK